MHRQHVAPQTQNERAGSPICGAKRRAGARIATFGASALVAGQLLLPGVALAAEMPEPAAGQDAAAAAAAEPVATEPAPAAAPTTRGVTDVAGGGGIAIETTVVDHFYDLELPFAFMLIQDEAFTHDFPDKPEGFTSGLNETVHFFKIDPDTEALVKTENPEEANVSISLVMIDNHVRATLVFAGGDADSQISYSLNLFHSTYLGSSLDYDSADFDGAQGTIRETRHDYYIRCAFNSNVYLIATGETDPEMKPDPEVRPEPAPQPEAEEPAAGPAPAKAAAVVKPAETALPATGDSGAMAVALGAAGAAAAAAAGVTAARRRNR